MTGNVRAFIERVGVLPSFLIAALSFMLRNAQTWSFGEFSINALPAPLPHWFAAVTGLGIALGLEILGSAAGGKWWMAKQRVVSIMADPRLPKRDRGLQAEHWKLIAAINLGFMIAGYGASVFAGVAFAMSLSGTVSPLSALSEFVVVCIMTLMIAYYGIFYEPEQPDPLKHAFAGAYAQVAHLATDIGSHIREGTHTAGEVRVLQGMLGPVAGSLLDPLTHVESDIEQLDTPAICRAIGANDEAAQRRVRRVLMDAYQNKPELGVSKKIGGKGYLCPATAMYILFASDFARLSNRTSSGQTPASDAGVKPIEVIGTGHGADIERTMSA